MGHSATWNTLVSHCLFLKWFKTQSFTYHNQLKNAYWSIYLAEKQTAVPNQEPLLGTSARTERGVDSLPQGRKQWPSGSVWLLSASFWRYTSRINFLQHFPRGRSHTGPTSVKTPSGKKPDCSFVEKLSAEGLNQSCQAQDISSCSQSSTGKAISQPLLTICSILNLLLPERCPGYSLLNRFVIRR
jgi:hypothetical protein